MDAFLANDVASTNDGILKPLNGSFEMKKRSDGRYDFSFDVDREVPGWMTGSSEKIGSETIKGTYDPRLPADQQVRFNWSSVSKNLNETRERWGVTTPSPFGNRLPIVISRYDK